MHIYGDREKEREATRQCEIVRERQTEAETDVSKVLERDRDRFRRQRST